MDRRKPIPMTDPFALCTREQIKIATVSRGLIEVRAWRFGDLAAYNVLSVTDGRVRRRPRWGLTHLPTGMSFGSSFANALIAVTAMQEIARLKNTWAFVTMEEGRAMAPKIRAIVRKYSGIPEHGQKGTDVDQARRMNGYEEEMI